MEVSSEESFSGHAIVEEWRSAPGYEEIYEVSNLGRVRRSGRAAVIGKGRGGGARIGRILAQHSVRNGYLAVQLWSGGKPKMLLVHRLVAAAFIGPCPQGQVVNHFDGNKQHNSKKNLEYATRSENNKHAYSMGLRRVTMKQQRALNFGIKRRKDRVEIECECGCGLRLVSPDRHGTDRRFIKGHNLRVRS